MVVVNKPLSGVQVASEFFARDLSEFSTQAVANTMWGCAVLNFYNQDMFDAAASAIKRACCPPSFAPQHCDNAAQQFLLSLSCSSEEPQCSSVSKQKEVSTCVD